MAEGPYSIGSGQWPGLAKAMEECGELIQAGAKIMAAGGADEHWDGAGGLHARLEDEIADVRAALTFLQARNSTLDTHRMNARTIRKLARFNTWHEQYSEDTP